MLLGVVATTKRDWEQQLAKDRVFLGAVPGSLECWLGIRSLRTLGLRVERQAKSAERLMSCLEMILGGATPKDLDVTQEEANAVKQVVAEVLHSTTQVKAPPQDRTRIEAQMENNLHCPVFAVKCNEERYTRTWPSKLKLWAHATSIGGVESLIEWRAMSDASIDTRLLRLSTGVEEAADLMADLLQGCLATV